MGWGYGVDLDPVVDVLRELRSTQDAIQRLLENLVTEVRDLRWAMDRQPEPKEPPKRRPWWKR